MSKETQSQSFFFTEVYFNLNRECRNFCNLSESPRDGYLSVCKDDAPVAVQSRLEGEHPQTEVVLQGNVAPLNKQCGACVTTVYKQEPYSCNYSQFSIRERQDKDARICHLTVISVKHR